MKKTAAVGSGKTYDVVETAIDLSKETRGTWEALVRRKGARPWASEIGQAPSNHEAPSQPPQDQARELP